MIGSRALRYPPIAGRHGLSLVEVLVVVAIVAILIAILLPAVQLAGEMARQLRCLDNLRQTGVAFHNHELTKGFYPTAVTGNGARYYWVAQILPYMEESSLAALYDYTVACNDIRNRDVVQSAMAFMCCPSASPSPRQDVRFKTGTPSWPAAVADYAGSSGPSSTLWNAPPTVSYAKPGSIDGFFKVAIKPGEKGRRIRDISDGASKSIAIFECAGRPQVWSFGRMSPDSGLASSPTTKYLLRCGWADTNQFVVKGFRLDPSQADPANRYVAPGSSIVNATNDSGIYGMHPGIASLLFADGSVRSIDESAAVDVVAALLTVQAGDAGPSR